MDLYPVGLTWSCCFLPHRSGPLLYCCVSVEDSAPLDGVKEYEVVRPLRLHTQHKRDTEMSRPDVVKYRMQVEGRDIVMHLEKNEGLLTKDYSETHYTDDGEIITTAPQDMDHCYYHGHIQNDSSSVISISTCDGLRGYFQTAGQRYLIEPLSEEDTGDHAVLKYESLNETPAVCGVTNTSWDDGLPSISKVHSRGSGPTLMQQQKYIELFLVADNREFNKMERNMNKLRKRVFEIINFANMAYRPQNTFIALTGLEVWTDQDKISVTEPAGQTLDQFTSWRNSQLVKSKKHDNAQLLTAIDFEGSTVGLAFVATLCSSHSTGVIQDHSPNAIAVGATITHEMGHNLGMNHDTSSCVCKDSSCIMAAALSHSIPKHFSSCSDTSYEKFLNNRNAECLLDKPDQQALISDPVCGNGFVEKGEQCDCGPVEECTNPCCNATTCKLTIGSDCAEGECCQNCKILSAAYECRAKKDECDLAEYCTGQSQWCPEDVFTVNGVPCKRGQGYCYNGQCPLFSDQCQRIWGTDAKVGNDLCYNANTHGVYYGYCRRVSGSYVRCQNKDVKCGRLFCTGGNDNPAIGRLVLFNNCKGTLFGDDEDDLGQVATGTICGNGQVCSNNECLDVESAYKSANCSAKCKGHGVCNHRLECQCESGWLPPNCDKKAANETSPGVTAAVVIICIVVLIVIFIIIVFIRRKKKYTSPFRSQSHLKTTGVTNPSFLRDRQQTTSDFQVTVHPVRAAPSPPSAANKPVVPPPPVTSKPPTTAPPFVTTYNKARAPPPSAPASSNKPRAIPPPRPVVTNAVPVQVKTRPPPVPTAKPGHFPVDARAALKPVNNPRL
ncbi:zinc metalloproteinase/disintegrin-like HR1a isoform X1 [Lepisosteus oculatus]|uniref:zinc metalloproteinase/disintegrin-like HR1a isoform X1 n=1 Tax=Lepisosteus oculatus TaxID=7918 RepID=UPI0035F510E3